MAIDLGPSFRDDRPGRRRGLSWLWAAPRWAARRSGEASASSDIDRGARLIADLASTIRGGPASAPDLLLHPSGAFDVASSAVMLGVSELELRRRLDRRQRQTAIVTWGAAAAAWVFLALWVWQVLANPASEGRVWAAFQFLPFCAAFFVLALRNAWQNWQLRMRRVGSVSAYLRTSDPFWPRLG